MTAPLGCLSRNYRTVISTNGTAAYNVRGTTIIKRRILWFGWVISCRRDGVHVRYFYPSQRVVKNKGPPSMLEFVPVIC